MSWTLKDEASGAHVSLTVAQRPQICTVCDKQMQGDWVAHLGGPWVHLIHVLEGLPVADGPAEARRVSHRVLHRGSWLPSNLAAACSAVEPGGLALIGLVEGPDDLVVAVFMGDPS